MASETSLVLMDLIRSVPAGRVTTYREVALAAGLPNGARQVARLLHSSARSAGLPWQRVIKADGSIGLPAGGGREIQLGLLKSEGVEPGPDGRFDLAVYRWDFTRPGTSQKRKKPRAP